MTKLSNDRLNIKLGQLISSLSLGLDIAENRYFGHSRRTAYISYNIAKTMGLREEDIIDTYYSSLVHDIGMSGQLAHYSVEEIHQKKDLIMEHCYLGSKIVKKLPLNPDVSNYLLYHHEEWNGNGPYGLKGDEIPISSQIIHFADCIDISYTKRIGNIGEKIDIDEIKKFVDNHKNEMFKGEICEAFLPIIETEKFWLDLKPENLRQVLDIIEPGKNIYIGIFEIKSIAESFSMLIDSKSNFTFEHSKGVANITRKFATYLGYDQLTIDKLEIAANLHDIGKLVVPSDILEKPAQLSKAEFEIIKSHPYYTKLILNQVEGIEEIAEWAGNHHEKLNGKGYPEKLDYSSITIEDQIIALADIYQALTENRPYRNGMNPQKAIDIMKDMAGEGYISLSMVSDLKQLVF